MTMIPCQFTSPDRKRKDCGRTALCTLKRASLTVEAAAVLPVFLLAMTMLISVIDICRIKIEGQAELSSQAKKLSMYAYVTPGIYEDEYVDLYKIETYDLPVKLFPFKTIKIALRARVHTWTGRRETEGIGADSSGVETGEMVYVTDRETVYHTHEDCSHLNLSIVQTSKNAISSLRNENGGKYYACEKCCGENGEKKDSHHITADESIYGSSTYYVSESGNAYHVSLNCSSLKRTAKLVKKTEVDYLDECQRCKYLGD